MCLGQHDEVCKTSYMNNLVYLKLFVMCPLLISINKNFLSWVLVGLYVSVQPVHIAILRRPEWWW